MRGFNVNLQPELCIIVRVRSKVITVVGEGVGRGRSIDRGGSYNRSIRRRGALDPCRGGGERVLLGLLSYLLLLRVGCNNLLCPSWLVADDRNRMVQVHAALCPLVDAETGTTDLVGLLQVSEFVPLGAHWRVAGEFSYLWSCYLWKFSSRWRYWGQFQSRGGSTKRGRIGRWRTVDDV